MPLQHISNVRIRGIATAVPRRCLEVSEWQSFKSSEDRQKYMDSVGVHRLRRHEGNMTCSDLCQAAAERLLQDIGWDAEDVDLLVFLSQSMDYFLPATACVLHGKMGMRQDCACFDIGMGCSGWTYGLQVVSSMVQSGVFKKALLLAGDARGIESKEVLLKDKEHGVPLFGDAGTATALCYDEAAPPMTFDSYTDGSGYEAIIRRVGRSRHPATPDSFAYTEDAFGHIHRPIDTEMDGAAVFVFGISKVPKAVKSLLRDTEMSVEDVDYFLFHQANLMMNEKIREKCKIPPEKCPYSLRDFGNNSSASIPLTIVTRLRDAIDQPGEHRALACGFGVGLSWSSSVLSLKNTVISPLVEL